MELYAIEILTNGVVFKNGTEKRKAFPSGTVFPDFSNGKILLFNAIQQFIFDLDNVDFRAGGAGVNIPKPATNVLLYDLLHPFFFRAVSTVETAIPIGRVWYVSNERGNNSTAERGNSNKPSKTIQDAFTKATTGDEIWIFKGSYPETATASNKTLKVVLEDAIVTGITFSSSSNTKIEGIGASRVNTLSLGGGSNAIQFYAENLTISTYSCGFAGVINFLNCTVNGYVCTAGSGQDFVAINTKFNNITITTPSAGNDQPIRNGYFYDCDFNTCRFDRFTVQGLFYHSRLSNTTLKHYTPKLAFYNTDLKTTTFNFTYSGGVPSATCNFISKNCVFAGFTFNNTSSSNPQSQFIVFTIDKTITTTSFNQIRIDAIPQGNITQDRIDEQVVTLSVANKLLN